MKKKERELALRQLQSEMPPSGSGAKFGDFLPSRSEKQVPEGQKTSVSKKKRQQAQEQDGSKRRSPSIELLLAPPKGVVVKGSVASGNGPVKTKPVKETKSQAVGGLSDKALGKRKAVDADMMDVDVEKGKKPRAAPKPLVVPVPSRRKNREPATEDYQFPEDLFNDLLTAHHAYNAEGVPLEFHGRFSIIVDPQFDHLRRIAHIHQYMKLTFPGLVR